MLSEAEVNLSVCLQLAAELPWKTREHRCALIFFVAHTNAKPVFSFFTKKLGRKSHHVTERAGRRWLLLIVRYFSNDLTVGSSKELPPFVTCLTGNVQQKFTSLQKVCPN